MGIIKIVFGGRRRKATVKTKPRPAKGTPVKYVRDKFWVEGRQYEVKLHQATRNRVQINEQSLTVSLTAMTRENFAALMDGWYRRRARAAFANALDRWLPEFRERGYEVPAPRLKLFRMRRAWGRCYYTKGLITINLHLIKASPECFDYIVLHELCHFVINSHSKAFHALLAGIMPDWQEVDRWLKDFARSSRILESF